LSISATLLIAIGLTRAKKFVYVDKYGISDPANSALAPDCKESNPLLYVAKAKTARLVAINLVLSTFLAS